MIIRTLITCCMSTVTYWFLQTSLMYFHYLETRVKSFNLQGSNCFQIHPFADIRLLLLFFKNIQEYLDGKIRTKRIDLLILDLLSVVWTSFYSFSKCGKKSFPFIQIFFYTCTQYTFSRLLRLRTYRKSIILQFLDAI